MPRYLNSPQPKFFACGVCGSEVPRKALACPECGADGRTGLHGEEDPSASLGLPDDEETFSYDDFIKREFGGSPIKPAGLHWVWWSVAVILLVIFVVFALHGL